MKEIVGLSPSASAASNTSSLQTALDTGGYIFIGAPGDYEFNATLIIKSNTTLHCAKGVRFIKTGEYGAIVRNYNALNKVYDNNIEIRGLEIVIGTSNSEETNGLNGEIAFGFIKNLRITDFKVNGGENYLNRYIISISVFERVYLENIFINEYKDGLWLFSGNNAVVKNADITSMDDSGGVGNGAWFESLYHLADTFNITFENCVFRKKTGQSGHAFRLSNCEWADWSSGDNSIYREVRLNAGNLYLNNTSGTTQMLNAPVHTSGIVTGADGIAWKFIQSDVDFYNVNTYGIKFKNCKFERSHITMAGLASCTLETRLSKFREISFHGCEFNSGETFVLVDLDTDGICNDITFDSCKLVTCNLTNYVNEYSSADVLKVRIIGCEFKTSFSIGSPSPGTYINCELHLTNNVSDIATEIDGLGGCRVLDSDVMMDESSIGYDVIGDIVRTSDGRKIYKSGGWVNLAV